MAILHCEFLSNLLSFDISPLNKKPLPMLLTRSTLHPQAGSNPAPIPAAKAVRSVENRIYPARGARREEHRARNGLSGTIIQKNFISFCYTAWQSTIPRAAPKGSPGFCQIE